MATHAQVNANRANSKKSTGPKTAEGKETSSQNRKVHGLSGSFCILPNEDKEDFRRLFDKFKNQHQPANPGEELIVLKLAEHYWLSQRAMYLQAKEFMNGVTEESERRLSLYVRYQTANDRAFSRVLNDLLKLQKERRKEQIGSESQQAKQSRERQRAEAAAAAENRKNELHRYAVMNAELKSQLAKKKLDADPSLQKAIQRHIRSQKAA